MRKTQLFIVLFVIVVLNTLISLLICQTADKDASSDGFFTTSTEKRADDNSKITASRRNSITEAVRRIEPAVVSINVIKTQVVRNAGNPFMDPFFGFFNYMPRQQQVQSIGTGVIVNEDGYIMTNSHVVEGATQTKVVLSDGRQFDATVVGFDEVHDIAVVKIKGDHLPVATLGTSTDLIIGEWAIAVGNPYGYLMSDSKPSVSVGVVSATNRDFAGRNDGKVYKGMIQTDAAINPGNSGGPLVNIYGEVIGINTFIFSENGGSVGIGFAIPVERAKKIVRDIIRNGKVTDTYYGFQVQEINPNLAAYLGIKDQDGVIVVKIDEKGPAARAGIKLKDIVKKVNGTLIRNQNDIELLLSDIYVGDNVTFTIQRNNHEQEITMEVEALK